MADFEVRGAEQFFALTKALKAAGRTTMRRELSTNLRRAGRPLIEQTRAAARRDLPSRGGLAAQVAREPQRVQVLTGARTAGVRIVVGKRRGGARAADAGLIRHPVFGTGRWVSQPVKPGWFSGTLTSVGPDIARPFMVDGIDATLNKIVREAGGG